MFSVVHEYDEDELTIIEKDHPYFIGRTTMWHEVWDDGRVCFGWIGDYNKHIIPIDYLPQVKPSEEYRETSTPCEKRTCVASTSLKGEGMDFNFCAGCHDSARDAWYELLSNHPDIEIPDPANRYEPPERV